MTTPQEPTGDVSITLPKWVVGALLDRRPSQIPNNSNAWWTLQRVLRSVGGES